ncbi:MAG TPA: class I SAM-dependent methyltransferase [Acidimicrobiales bacterium]|nr:class I SAM-dependent methyltransferase [Acidimicrobiales bacterium]
MPVRAKTAITSGPYRAFVGRVVAPWVLGDERPAGEGLEIGAGGGALSAGILRRCPTLTMVVTDADPAMVDAAGRALVRVAGRARVERADAEALPFADARFDLVVSAAMLHHTSDRDRALSEVRRVLRPGGRVLGYDMVDHGLFRLTHIHRRGPGHGRTLFAPGEVGVALAREGFTDVATTPGPGSLVERFAATRPAA